MSVSARDSLREDIINTLLATFPNASRVNGGIGFMSGTMDEDTGLFYPVVISVSAKNTAATARSEAFDLDKAIADFAAKPGRRVADPSKAANRAAEAEAIAQRKAANMSIIKSWLAANPCEGLTTKEIWDAIPEIQHLQVMQLASPLKALVEEGVLEVALNDKRKKIYSKA